MRPTRRPNRVVKLFNRISGWCSVRRPAPGTLSETCTLLTLKKAVGPWGSFDSIKPLHFFARSDKTITCEKFCSEPFLQISCTLKCRRG